MSWNYTQILKIFSQKETYKLLADSDHALERECLRIKPDGTLSNRPHPKSLGSAFKNPLISTDFAEAQLELITPSFKREEKALDFLKDLHLFINCNSPNELLWPLSMPCQLPKKEKDIELAQFGLSKEGQKRTIYRSGLGMRYGRKMQTVSGTHYNFSFSKDLWELLHKKFDHQKDFQKFITESYLKIIRNFLRDGWLNTYLFGSSPAIDKSYCTKRYKALKKFDKKTYYSKFATSLRTSNVGYYSKVQAQLAVSYNSLNQHIKDLKYAISTTKPLYKKFGIEKGGKQTQLNDRILQLASEHYSRIRAKQPPKQGEGILEALTKRGIKYIEVRAVDIDPFEAIGVIKDQLCFLHLFLIYCLFKKSPRLTTAKEKEITEKQNKVALFGRMRKSDLMKEAEKMLNEMEPIAKLMDKSFKKPRYMKTLKIQLAKLKDTNLTPSAKILDIMKENKEGHLEFGLRLAKEHREFFKSQSLDKKRKQQFEKAAEKSLIEQKKLEMTDEIYLEGYEDLELSTQLLIREALVQKIKVEVLDRKASFIRLTKGRKVEYVKQATETSKDSYITARIMENKHVSKIILSENKIRVAKGEIFTNMEDALNSYSKFSSKNLVIKPNSTNFGIGISFSNNKQEFKEALKEAFKHDKTIIVEEYLEGDEYRFTVIDKKVVGIVKRLPASVVGNGKSTIKKLVEDKNLKNTKPDKYHIKLGKIEKEELKTKGLRTNSIPKSGEIVFLRKNSNVSTGGETIDVTDEISQEYKKIAIKSAQSVEAKICGVDMVIKNTNVPPTKRNHGIIEINFNPAIFLHKFPDQGKSRAIEKDLLKFLGF